MAFPGVPLVFAENAAAVGLAVKVVFFREVAAFAIALPEILIKERNADFSGDLLGDGFHQLVVLVRTDEKSGGECIEGTLLGYGSGPQEAHPIAELAADIFSEDDLPQEAAEVVLVVINDRQADLLGELPEGLKSPGELGVRVDVGIVEKAGNAVAGLKEVSHRKRAARPAANVQKNVHGHYVR